ncbi:Flp family type IVb pilin [Candidatus Dormiibacter inghamiae]
MRGYRVLEKLWAMPGLLAELMLRPLQVSDRARQRGQGMVEYGLILALVAVVVIVVLTQLGTAIQGKFTQIVGALK